MVQEHLKLEKITAIGVFSQFDLQSDSHGQILQKFIFSNFFHKADSHKNFSQNPVTFYCEVLRESDILQQSCFP
jgi:hypothetical protein